MCPVVSGAELLNCYEASVAFLIPYVSSGRTLVQNNFIQLWLRFNQPAKEQRY